MENQKKIFLTYKEEEGKIVFDKVFISIADNFTKEDFNPEVHLPLLSEFFKENGVSDILEAEAKRIFARFKSDELTSEMVNEFLGGAKVVPQEEILDSGNDHSLDDDGEYIDDESILGFDPESRENAHPLDDDDEYMNGDEEYTDKKKIAKRLGYGIGAAILLSGGLSIIHSCKKEKVETEKAEISDDLYKNLTEEQRTFFEPTFSAVKDFNNKATKAGNFAKSEDKTTLHISAYEAVALNIVMNDYTTDELYAIMGSFELDATNLMDLARSAYSKLSVYYMNAKEASGLASIINDQASREFFERHENAIIEFNKNNSTELSDKVIKNLYYDYVKDGSEAEYSKVNSGVAWFATTTATGFELANRNVESFLRINNVSEEEITKFGDAAAAIGMSLRDMTASELLSGINEAYDLGILDEMDNKSLCATVTAETKEKVESLKMKQQIATVIITTNAKNDLVKGLREIGANTLANEVESSDVLSVELLEKVSEHNANASELVEKYNGKLAAVNSGKAKIAAVLEIAQETFGRNTEIDLADLVNNRTKALTLEQTLDNDGIPAVDADEFNKLSPSEKDDYIKENGVVTGTTTTKTKVEVSESDLTPSEKNDAEAQKAAMAKTGEIENELITAGATEANQYAEKKGAYDFNPNSVTNPYNKEVVNLDGRSLFDGVVQGVAFGTESEKSRVGAINSDDAQIEKARNNLSKDDFEKLQAYFSDAELVKYLTAKYGSDYASDLKNLYNNAFDKQIDGSLAVAEKTGEQLRKNAKDAFDKAQEAVDKANGQNETPKEEPTKEPTKEPTEEPKVEPETPTVPIPGDTPTVDITDPNLNPGHTQPDEQPYTVREIEEPLYYLDDAVWEAAFSKVNSGAVKTK